MVMISSNYIVNFTNVCVIGSFLTKLLTLGILFSTAVRAVVVVKLVNISYSVFNLIFSSIRILVVAKLLILVISFLTSFILAS